MSKSLDPKTKLKAAQAKQNGVNGNRELPPRTGTGIYTTGIVKPPSTAATKVLYNRLVPGNWSREALQGIREPKVKKGCGQRKNKRDKAGRALHAEICRINQRYPGADVATIRAQVRSGQLT